MARSQPRATPFADVDAMPPHIVEQLVGSLDRQAAHPEIQRVRQVALDALAPAPGQRLLDAGAGLGEVARHLATLVAPGGSVVALDRSTASVRLASERHDGSAVEYRVGDVTALDFPDGSFDGVRVERVLQHLPDPDRGVAELVRVTRPGGRVCLVDTDWESLAFDGMPDDLVQRLRDHFLHDVASHQRTVGRTLRGRLVHAGLSEVATRPVALCLPTPESAAQVLPVASRRVPREARIFPEGPLRDRWFAALDEAGARGDFLATLTIWVAWGVRPA